MVFCASLVPWPRLYAAAEISWSLRNHLSTRAGLKPRKIHNATTEMISASPMPMIGDMTMNTSVFVQPDGISDDHPAFAMAAPA